jgi:hypothetical protein
MQVKTTTLAPSSGDVMGVVKLVISEVSHVPGMTVQPTPAMTVSFRTKHCRIGLQNTNPFFLQNRMVAKLKYKFFKVIHKLRHLAHFQSKLLSGCIVLQQFETS